MKIKPCPFCGGEAEFYVYRDYVFQETNFIACQQCGMRCECETHLIEKWNTRCEPPSNDVVPAGNERLGK